MNIAFIPVRGDSKSIPLKNIKEINGKPLVYWTAKAANDAECIGKVIIATDSEEIKTVVKSFKLTKVQIYDRDKKNAEDTSSTESVMIEYIQKTPDLKPKDLFFLIQATSPMLESKHIDEMYQAFISGNADSMFSGVVEKQFHWKFLPQMISHNQENYVVPVNYDYRNRPRRQEFEGLVAENGACYINSVGNIMRDKCRLSGNIAAYELPNYTKYEIDEPEDWVVVEELMKNFINK